MTKVRTIECFSFEELSDTAQEKALAEGKKLLANSITREEMEEVLLNNLAILLTGDINKKPADFRFQELDVFGRIIILGAIKREEAPLLMWPDTVSGVLLQDGDYAGQIIAVQDLEGSTDYSPELAKAREVVIPQIYDALTYIKLAGRDYYRAIAGTERLKAVLLDLSGDAKYLFLEDGSRSDVH
jgi:hypothetical protein